MATIVTRAGKGSALTHNEVDANFTNLNTELATKANSVSPTFTGTATLPSTTSIGSVTSTELGYLSGVTSSIQTQINAKLSTSATTYVQQSGPTGSAYLPAGTTAQRPGTPAAGYIRYNSTTGKFEGFGTSWGNIGGGAAIGDTPPSNPGAGDLWWESDNGRLFVYYTDANSSQWVDTSAGGAGQYLPLTGGAVTGTVSVAGTGVPFQVSSSNNNNVISVSALGTIGGYIGVNGNALTLTSSGVVEALKIDASGRVNMANQPAFSAYWNGANQSISAPGTRFNFNVEHFDNTNNYSAGLFTAPIAGRYQFNVNGLCYAGQSCYIQVRKNGAFLPNVQMYASGVDYFNMSLPFIVQLAANDTIDVYVQYGNLTSGYWSFSGHLLG